LLRLRILLVAAVTAATIVALTPTRAWAPVPPKNCGFMSVRHHSYNIKADQIRCLRARRYARRYLKTHVRPPGYHCRNYSARETSIKFRCSKGVKVIFAIRR
jgi:hypothetical protein